LSAGTWTEAAHLTVPLPKRGWECLWVTADVASDGWMVGIPLSELFVACGNEWPGSKIAITSFGGGKPKQIELSG